MPGSELDSLTFHRTRLGRILLADSLEVLSGDSVKEKSVNLIVTSPPFGLVRKKDYGNPHAEEYVDWFRPFASAFKRVLRDDGSLVIDIGGAWVEGRSSSEFSVESIFWRPGVTLRA